MVYFKSILAGCLAALLAGFLAINAVVDKAIFTHFRETKSDFVFVAWDPLSFASRPQGWLILACAFLLGFIWQYRRSSIRTRADLPS